MRGEQPYDDDPRSSDTFWRWFKELAQIGQRRAALAQQHRRLSEQQELRAAWLRMQTLSWLALYDMIEAFEKETAHAEHERHEPQARP